MTPSVSWASRRAKAIPGVKIAHNVSFEGNSSDFCWHADSHATRFCDESLMTENVISIIDYVIQQQR